ncbi:MAG: hypothetical protein MHM6MM_001474 [Cercozoa sp. M6MM]
MDTCLAEGSCLLGAEDCLATRTRSLDDFCESDYSSDDDTVVNNLSRRTSAVNDRVDYERIERSLRVRRIREDQQNRRKRRRIREICEWPVQWKALWHEDWETDSSSSAARSSVAPTPRSLCGFHLDQSCSCGLLTCRAHQVALVTLLKTPVKAEWLQEAKVDEHWRLALMHVLLTDRSGDDISDHLVTTVSQHVRRLLQFSRCHNRRQAVHLVLDALARVLRRRSVLRRHLTPQLSRTVQHALLSSATQFCPPPPLAFLQDAGIRMEDVSILESDAFVSSGHWMPAMMHALDTDTVSPHVRVNPSVTYNRQLVQKAVACAVQGFLGRVHVPHVIDCIAAMSGTVTRPVVDPLYCYNQGVEFTATDAVDSNSFVDHSDTETDTETNTDTGSVYASGSADNTSAEDLWSLDKLPSVSESSSESDDSVVDIALTDSSDSDSDGFFRHRFNQC